jgi:hypothetical protein
MEHDFFKRYLQEHKEAFEQEELPPHMLNNILNNLKERQAPQVKKSLKLGYTWLAAACSILIVAGAYLFLLGDNKDIKTPQVTTVANHEKNDAVVEQPVGPEITEQPISKNKIAAKPPTKKLAVHKPQTNQYQEIYDGLADSSSVAGRLAAVLKAGALTALNNKMKTALCRTFSKDNNDNVRLATLDVLSKFANDKYIQQQLINGLSAEKDPVIQIQLVKTIGNNKHPETNEKLLNMANNPLTVEAVKEQVYYALLTQEQ